MRGRILTGVRKPIYVNTTACAQAVTGGVDGIIDCSKPIQVLTIPEFVV